MIFISHAAADKPVIDEFFNLLQTGAGVTLEEAFISSVSGTGVPAGEAFVTDIKSHLQNADLFIPFITPNYYASRFCIAELGAAWIREMSIFPLITPDLDREIGSNMLGTHTERVDGSGLNRLFDRIKSILPARKWDTDRWELMRDQFLDRFEEKYPDLPDPDVVDRSLLEAERKRAEVAMQLRSEAEAALSNAKKQIVALEAAKDADAVRDIKKEFSTDREVYENLLHGVVKELEKHNYAVLRALYASFVNSDWAPDSDSRHHWAEEIERGIGGERLMADDRDNPRLISANTNHPQLRKAYDALQVLDDYLSSEISEDLSEALEKEYELPVSVSNRDFWEDVILEGRSLPE